MAQIGIVALIVILVAVAVIIAMPSLNNMVANSTWAKVQIEIERSHRLMMFLLAMLAVIAVLVGGGLLAWVIWIKSGAPQTSHNQPPQITYNSYTVYLPPGYSREEVFSGYVAAGWINPQDAVKYVETPKLERPRIQMMLEDKGDVR